jgi:hypothetical protein
LTLTFPTETHVDTGLKMQTKKIPAPRKEFSFDKALNNGTTPELFVWNEGVSVGLQVDELDSETAVDGTLLSDSATEPPDTSTVGWIVTVLKLAFPSATKPEGVPTQNT